MEDGYSEYSVFTVTDKNGKEIELAAVEEFEFDHKQYVAGAMIVGDEINVDEVYIYRAKITDGNIEAEKITDPKEYDRVTEAYLELE